MFLSFLPIYDRVNILSLYKNKGNKKTFGKKLGLTFIILFLAMLLIVINYHQSDIYSVDAEGSVTVTIIATENFGKTVLLDKKLIIESGESAMDILNKVATVTTTYGGGYVESINGIKSQYNGGAGEKKDWLYYINGMLASVGSNMYKLHPDDIERWDFHDWRSDQAVTAIIGDYPEPFQHGYSGRVAATTIVHAEEFYESAFELQQSLENYGISVSINHLEELSESEKKSNNIIFIDTYENDLIGELNADADQLGWFIEYEKNSVVTFDETGAKDRTFDHGGVILATQNIWNPKGNWHCENVIWIISGITHDDVTAAAELLITNHKDIKHCASLIIVDGTIYQVP